MKYNVGDKVRVRSDLDVFETYGDGYRFYDGDLIGQIVTIESNEIEYYYLEESSWPFIDEMFEDSKTQSTLIINKPNMSLIQKMKLVLAKEPEKSFIKAGVMNEQHELTEDGKDAFINWLFQENKDAFNDEVVKKILKEEKKDKK